MPNPFDLKSALLAKHAQHVVLIHFPIALYLSGTCFDLCARIFRKVSLADTARWNFLVAAVTSVPAALTGLLAWQFALEGHRLTGVLRLHLVLALTAVIGFWLTIALRRSPTSEKGARHPLLILGFEVLVSGILGAASHLGGILSGVNL
jgi:uncharacterized membrane protein